MLLITVIECSFEINATARGLLMLPGEPVETIFIYFFIDTKVQHCQKTDVAGTTVFVVEMNNFANSQVLGLTGGLDLFFAILAAGLYRLSI